MTASISPATANAAGSSNSSSSAFVFECDFAGSTKLWKTIGHGVPDAVDVDAVIVMAQDISEAAYRGGWNRWRNRRHPFRADLYYSLRDTLQTALDGIDGLPVGGKALGIHSTHIFVDPVDIFDNVTQSMRFATRRLGRDPGRSPPGSAVCGRVLR